MKEEIKKQLIGETPIPILAGECAFQYNGLTTLIDNSLQCWTLSLITPNRARETVIWYFNPFADKYMETALRDVTDLYLTPTRERAIIEYIIFNDYFDEGILIEGIQSYMGEYDGKLEDLYRVGKLFHLDRSYIDYWWKEALEYPRT